MNGYMNTTMDRNSLLFLMCLIVPLTGRHSVYS